MDTSGRFLILVFFLDSHTPHSTSKLAEVGEEGGKVGNVGVLDGCETLCSGLRLPSVRHPEGAGSEYGYVSPG